MMIFLPVLLLWRTTHAATVQNGVAGFPEIKCLSDSVLVRFDTLDRFEGHSFVKGHYGDEDCNTQATNQQFSAITVRFDTCGVRRERSANPPGIFMSTTVVISFHPMFVTMVDRAYNIRCFYMEAGKTVTSKLDVSFFPDAGVVAGPASSNLTQFDTNMLTTGLLTQTVPMPVCRYEVLQDNRNGPLLRFARIGDVAYHRWICEGPTDDVFCMTVHSCYVDNGSGSKFPLLDADGCAQDRFLMSNIVYQGDLEGGQSTMVFKFADRPSVLFDCQIRLTLKTDSFCVRTSDTCVEPVRGKRQALDPLRQKDRANESVIAIDVYSDEITVINDIATSPRDSSASRQLRERLHEMNMQDYMKVEGATTDLCMPKLTFAICATCAAVSVLTVLFCVWFRGRRPGKV